VAATRAGHPRQRHRWQHAVLSAGDPLVAARWPSPPPPRLRSWRATRLLLLRALATCCWMPATWAQVRESVGQVLKRSMAVLLRCWLVLFFAGRQSLLAAQQQLVKLQHSWTPGVSSAAVCMQQYVVSGRASVCVSC
jgi:hypothetical protein